jgi:hypothetical protein
VVSEQAKSLIKSMLAVDARKRFSAQQVMQHEWMQQHTKKT